MQVVLSWDACQLPLRLVSRISQRTLNHAHWLKSSFSGSMLLRPAKHASTQASELDSSGAREYLADQAPFLLSSSPSSSLKQRPGQTLTCTLEFYQYHHRCHSLSCRKVACLAGSCPTYYCRMKASVVINCTMDTISWNWWVMVSIIGKFRFVIYHHNLGIPSTLLLPAGRKLSSPSPSNFLCLILRIEPLYTRSCFSLFVNLRCSPLLLLRLGVRAW